MYTHTYTHTHTHTHIYIGGQGEEGIRKAQVISAVF